MGLKIAQELSRSDFLVRKKGKFTPLDKTKWRGKSLSNGINMLRLMDLDELADYLRLQKQTIYNWLHQGKISGMKVGGVWRFDRREIDAWLKSRQRLAKDTESGEKP